MRRRVRDSEQAGAEGGREEVVGEVGEVAGAPLGMDAFFNLTGTYLLITE